MHTPRMILLTIAALVGLASPSRATTYTVVNTADSGAGSLRWAISSANMSSGADTIAFAVPGTGPHSITPATALPAIMDTVVIDGYTQKGAVANTNPMTLGINAVLQIELNGTSAVTGVTGGALDVRSSGSVVRGLVIGRWDIPGVRLGGTGGHAVEGCFIGTTPSGAVGLPNTMGILVESDGNVIGGGDEEDRNLISGNTGEGIYVGGDSTVVRGNFVGTDITGTSALANGNAGVHVDLGSHNRIGGPVLRARNLISGNAFGAGGGGDGVWILSGAGNDITGNYIGVDVTGLNDLGNEGNGVYIHNSAGGRVGGGTSEHRNVISGNLKNGVLLEGTTNHFRVSGNYIGCDATGLAALANVLSGVMTLGTEDNMIGGESGGYGNIISGNGDYGVNLSSTADTVQANYIGTDSSGTGAIPNLNAGIRLDASGCIIGKTGGVSPTGSGNVIAFNSKGVIVVGASGNTIRANAIHSNDELGIDLVDDGVTPNDPGDIDTGPNGLQNFPGLAGADVGWNHTRVTGVLQSSATDSFLVDVYTSATCDASGYGEGETYLGSTIVVTDVAGDGVIDVCFPVFVPVGNQVTATATGPDGTSEFSSCIAVAQGLIVTNANPSGPGSLAEVVANCAACPGYDAITFNIPGMGPHTIIPTSPISVGAWDLIDGYSQVGASQNTSPLGMGTNAALMIEVDLSSSQIILAEGNSWIRGLAINSSADAGVLIQSDSNRVDGCFIGTDVTGTSAKPNGTGIRSEVTGNNRIGGDTAAKLNLISGNAVYGIHLVTNGNIVEGNLIGTDPTGTTALGAGIGIHVTDSDKNFIGGTTLGARNVISGGHDAGVHVSGSATWTEIKGNYIGTDVTGTVALPNIVGIAVDGGATDSKIGGTDPGTRNIISGNAMGVDISGSLTTDHSVTGNLIGMASDGSRLGNANSGVRIVESSGNAIGDTARGAGNIIVFNGTTGVVLEPGLGAANNPILGNSIHDNAAGLGIDWGNDGVTANSPFDGYQDFPVLTSVVAAPGSTMIATTVSADPWAEVIVQYFDNSACDPSGHGEGEVLIGDTLVTTDGLGDAQFVVTLPIAICRGWVSATATIATETSEFSACTFVINTPAGANVVVEPRDPACLTPATLTFGQVSSGGFTSVSYPDSCPDIPVGYLPGDSAACYEFVTTATFNKPIEVCIEYDEDGLAGPEEDLRLLYTDSLSASPEWTDITTFVDTVENVICGDVDSLGVFVYAVIDPNTGVKGGSPTLTAFDLHQNVPNPFNPATVIRYDVPVAGGKVTLCVYDVAGRLVRTLVDKVETPGEKRVVWNGRNDRGNRVATGVYFYRMTAPEFAKTRKTVLLK